MDGSSAALPVFRYHPDPMSTGSVVASSRRCRGCGESRGFIYAGPVYAEEDLNDRLCPWCLADGSAHRDFGATFVDSEAFSGDLPPGVVAEVCERTPGFDSWQPERWPDCCGDAAAFFGPVGIREIRELERPLEGAVLDALARDLEIAGEAARSYLESLDRDAGPTAYHFRCLHCGAPRVHVDRP